MTICFPEFPHTMQLTSVDVLAWKQAMPWAMAQGATIIPVGYSIATMDLKPQLLQLRDAEVDYIWMLVADQIAN